LIVESKRQVRDAPTLGTGSSCWTNQAAAAIKTTVALPALAGELFCQLTLRPMSPSIHRSSLVSRRTSLFLLLAALLGLFSPATTQAQRWDARTEYVVCSGGPALRKWEELRVEADRHDKYWANFITSAYIRMKNLRAENPDLRITWLIYRPGYVTRQVEDANNSLAKFRTDFAQIAGHAAEVGAKLVWFNSTAQWAAYLNDRSSGKMSGFEYFGHSNKFCFLMDYSNDVSGASSCYVHEKYLSSLLRRGLFVSDAHVQSWGCNTGESMSQKWKSATGHAMLGAAKSGPGTNGKTDYRPIGDGRSMPSVSGKWAD
jgi:hypothetical protein